MELCIVSAWSTKNKRCSDLDLWIVPMFCSGSAAHRTLRMGRCSILDPNVLLSFFDTMLLSSHVDGVRVSRMFKFLLLVQYYTGKYSRTLSLDRFTLATLAVIIPYSFNSLAIFSYYLLEPFKCILVHFHSPKMYLQCQCKILHGMNRNCNLKLH